MARGVLLARGVDLGVTRGEALLDSKGVPRGVGWVGVRRLVKIIRCLFIFDPFPWFGGHLTPPRKVFACHFNYVKNRVTKLI